MGALIGLGVLVLVGGMLPWRWTLVLFAVCAAVILTLSGGSLSHW